LELLPVRSVIANHAPEPTSPTVKTGMTVVGVDVSTLK